MASILLLALSWCIQFLLVVVSVRESNIFVDNANGNALYSGTKEDIDLKFSGNFCHICLRRLKMLLYPLFLHFVSSIL